MNLLLNWGYYGLSIGSFLAATIVPLSPNIFVFGMLCAGMKPFWVFVVATCGNWLGSLTTYYLGWLGKWKWIERWFKITPEKLAKQQTKISKYGSLLAFLVWIPIVGDIFALALGFYKVNPLHCTIFILIGKTCRFIFFILLFQYADEWLGLWGFFGCSN